MNPTVSNFSNLGANYLADSINNITNNSQYHNHYNVAKRECKDDKDRKVLFGYFRKNYDSLTTLYIEKFTHLAFESVEINENGSMILTEEDKTKLTKFLLFKKRKPNLKLLICILISRPNLNKIWSNDSTKQQLMNTVDNFLETYKFDGIELFRHINLKNYRKRNLQPGDEDNWDYRFNVRDKDLFTQLIEALREKFTVRSLIWSTLIPLSLFENHKLIDFYSMEKIEKHFDYFNIYPTCTTGSYAIHNEKAFEEALEECIDFDNFRKILFIIDYSGWKRKIEDMRVNTERDAVQKEAEQTIADLTSFVVKQNFGGVSVKDLNFHCKDTSLLNIVVGALTE